MSYASSQPFKGIYAVGAGIFELATLPIFLAKNSTSYGRPNPEWTFRQAILVKIFGSALLHIATMQVPTPLPLTAGKEKERWVTFKPAGDEVYKGPLRSNPDVKPLEIGGTWYPTPLNKDSDKSNIKVMLHIHGGAFVIADGRTSGCGAYSRRLVKQGTATHIFCPQYRLSTLPISKTSDPFPAGLQDTLTSYLYLIHDLGISPKDIILSGDSAGANLAIALLRYLNEYGAELNIPNPSAALMWSPWIDPSDTSCSYVHDNPNYYTDYLSPAFTQWGSNAYAGLQGLESLNQPYINHKLKAFKTEVPIWVNTGSSEVLYYDDKEWAELMKKAGNDVTLMVEKNTPHDQWVTADSMGFAESGDRSAKHAAEWLKGKR